MKVLLLVTCILAISTLPFSTSQINTESSLEIRSSIMDKLMESSSPELFKAYHMVFKKEYSLTSPEGIQRKQVFEENVRIIKETNEKNLSYKLGINQFSDLSKAEFKAKYLTLKKEELDNIYNRNFLEYTEPFESNLQGIDMNFNWTNNFRSALQQGGCGSCWAFATAGTIEGNYDIAFPQATKVAFSPQYLVDCDTDWNGGCNGGDPGTAFSYIIKNGIPYDNSYPYKGVQQSCNSSVTLNKVVTEVQRCYNCTKEQIKGLLSKGPLSVVIDGSEIQQYRSGVFEAACYEVNHAVIMAGASIDAQGNGYYIVRNSWDVSWGEKGYIRVKSGSPARSCFLESSALLPIVKKSDAPIPDPPAPKCAKIYTECGFNGVGYEVCGNTPVIPTTLTSGFEIGKFATAKLFMGPNCSSGFYTLNSNWDCFDGYSLKNGLKSIMVGNDPTPPFGCLWIYDESCLSGNKYEICSSVKDLNTISWANKIASVAVGSGIKYTLNTQYGWATTRSSHSYGLSSTFFKKVSSITISPLV